MDLFAIREELSKSGVMICFTGPFSHSIIDEIGQAVRNHLSAENIAKAAVMDVFAAYIELAQNVKNYCATRTLPTGDPGSSIITIAKLDGRYQVSSGNVVLREDIAPLLANIDSINALDPAGLKARYKEQMRRDRQPGAMGAGLGLLDIARRSPEKLSYSVRDLDGNYAFFSLAATV
ncbi:SiaB family protein kinase [Fundidesulfovibrio soli]|uniref:SiaB family protein kinase n=1 Tax=Fundidesulfovibrio soli TaxID=2922716 RepID=UPI001FAFEBB9|nr:SiaB family protein kinase [Fundidesulfovibrio soli]